MLQENGRLMHLWKNHKRLLGLGLHLCIFIIIQLAFFAIGDYEDWHIFKLNGGGESVAAFLKPIEDYVHIHQSYQFNVITAFLIVALILHVGSILLEVVVSKRKAS
ncbi:hypothetical protein [Oceanobacillus kapialis]|uniref:Cytochrome b561 bacterial/Ni-hydrogenase domain-containing protein n=1 Tax=Oceanobacillus kapialis TaxID=481353 RepID=A0ABW5PVL1_9BACI